MHKPATWLNHLYGGLVRPVSELFRTRRLVCRRLNDDDVDALYAVYSDPEGMRWVGDGQPISKPACHEWLRVTANNYVERGYGMFALEDRCSRRVLGFCGLVHPGGQPEVEVKYALMRGSWGKGLASEAIPALLVYAATVHRVTRVIATVAPENLASQRVLSKAGFTLAAVRRNADNTLTQVHEWLRRGAA